MKNNNQMSTKTTPKVRKIRIGFGIAGAIVIVLTAIACYLILAPKSSASINANQKYAAQWDSEYGNVPEDIKYDITQFSDGYWCFMEDGTGIHLYPNELPAEENTAWLQRGREELKNSESNHTEEALLAAKYDFLVTNGNFVEGEPEMVRMLGEVLFDKKDSFSDEEWTTIHDQLAAGLKLCSMDLQARKEIYGEP